MKIYEIGEREQIRIVARKGASSLEFTATIVMNKKDILFVEPIIHKNRVVDFDAREVRVEVVYVGADQKPYVWKKCLIKYVKYGNKKYHAIYSAYDGKKMNRRNTYRQHLGVSGLLQIKSTADTRLVIVKDISLTGIAFVLNDLSLHREDIGNFHLNFRDKDFGISLHIDAAAEREVDAKGGKRVIAGRIQKCNVNLSEYIAVKQKKEMAKRWMRGSLTKKDG